MSTVGRPSTRHRHRPARGRLRQRHAPWSAASAATRSTLGPYYACPECFGPLEVAYDFPAVTREQIEAGPRNIWRYKALLPVPDRHRAEPQHRARLHPAARGAQPRPRARHRRTSGSRTTPPTRPTPSRTASSPCALSAARELGSKVFACPVDRQPGQRGRRRRRPRRHQDRGLHPAATSSSPSRSTPRSTPTTLVAVERQLRRRQPARLARSPARRRAGRSSTSTSGRTTPRAPRRSATRSPSSSAGGCPTRSSSRSRPARS